MIGTLIGLIFFLIILGVVWWAMQTLMALLPIAEPFKTIIYVVTIVIFVVIVVYVMIQLLSMAGISVPMGMGKLGN